MTPRQELAIEGATQYVAGTALLYLANVKDNGLLGIMAALILVLTPFELVAGLLRIRLEERKAGLNRRDEP